MIKTLPMPHFSRRSILGVSGLLMAAPAILRAAELNDEPVVATDGDGESEGRSQRRVEIYRGIPYGGDVTASGRFLPATPAPPWTGVRDATRLGPPSLQPAGGAFGLNEPAPAENCLFLNIWAPAGRVPNAR